MPARTFSRRLTRTYFVSLIGIILIGTVVFLWRFQAEVSAADWVQHTTQVIIAAKDAEIDLRAMQVNLRSAILLPGPQYRDRVDKAERNLADTIAQLTSMAADNSAQQRRLLEVSRLNGKWAAMVAGLMTSAATHGLEQGPFQEVESAGRDIQSQLDEVIADEYQLLARRRARQLRASFAVYVTAILLGTLTAVLLGYSGWRQIHGAAAQFATALAEAEDANRAKDNFLATVSHELRNPISSILLSSRVALSSETLDQRTRQSLTAIERAARAQAQLVEDLLDLSRIESGRLRLDVQMVDLTDVVKAALETTRPAADAKSIELSEILDPRASPVAGDPGRLQQVVWNLVSNAVKFTPKGGKVQVRLQRINSHVEIVVADNGAGIEPSALAHIFEPFWQAGDSEHRRVGVGLGLSIVKQIVTMHGGTVIAHSDGLGKGATFTVRLPLPVSIQPSLEPRRHPTVEPTANTAAAPRLDGLSVLVVDDDPDACDALKQLFGSLGATVVAELSAQGALASYDRLHPDVVVSDIGMPGQTGFHLAMELRARERRSGNGRHVPLVALTAYGRVEDKIQILDAGFDSHVIKPVDIAELAATIKSLIAARESAA
jgi:signal transduction histidine kinase/ActR/RegA family two-component response regulator